MKKSDKDKFSFSDLKEMFKDKRKRAKIELTAYFIFFIIVIIFARVSSNAVNTNIRDNTSEVSFINNIKDNYEYSMNISINGDTYNYHIKVLGNNSYIERKSVDEEKYFYIMNNKYYEQDNNGNYILTTIEEVYPYISYNYLNIENIKVFIKSGIREGDTYKIKVSDIMLNSDSSVDIAIKVEEDNKTILIDYTNLLKITKDNIENASVKMVFDNINNIMSLE